METAMAIKGTDFVMMASTETAQNQEMLEAKCLLHPLSEYSMMTFGGVSDGCSLRFKKKLLRQLVTFEVSNGYKLTPKVAMHFSRTNVARYKRGQPSKQISIMIGGYDPTNGPELHLIDMNGMATPIPYGLLATPPKITDCHLQINYKPNLNQEGAFKILKKCADHIKRKVPGNTFNFDVFLIQKCGIKRYSDSGQHPLKRGFSRRLH